jgi:hypothetical protein
MAVVEESEYKGNPMIVLRRSAEDRYPFQFGLSKAKLVLDSVEEIKAWVAKQEAEKAAKAPAAGAAEAEG